jgi:hypothetical protein
LELPKMNAFAYPKINSLQPDLKYLDRLCITAMGTDDIGEDSVVAGGVPVESSREVVEAAACDVFVIKSMGEKRKANSIAPRPPSLLCVGESIFSPSTPCS